jgi:hypothetical protein
MWRNVCGRGQPTLCYRRFAAQLRGTFCGQPQTRLRLMRQDNLLCRRQWKVASDMRVFSVRSRRARTGRNPRNGANFAVEEKSFPFFKSGKEMRSASIAGNVSAHLDVTADPLAICFIWHELLAATVVANGSQGSHY